MVAVAFFVYVHGAGVGRDLGGWARRVRVSLCVSVCVVGVLCGCGDKWFLFSI